MTPDAIIATLGLKRHPEGGHFVETFRDKPDHDGRARSTAIYYLLRAGERSHWHRVDAAEVWLWHAGDALTLCLSDDGRTWREVVLGADLEVGQRPQAIVPPGAWQAAETRGAWTLVSCVVAPGFEFAGFELAAPDWKPG
jgi:predicted cupin superfamily sugar epimerase